MRQIRKAYMWLLVRIVLLAAMIWIIFFSGAFVCTGTGQWHVSLCESGRSSDRFPDGT